MQIKLIKRKLKPGEHHWYSNNICDISQSPGRNFLPLDRKTNKPFPLSAKVLPSNEIRKVMQVASQTLLIFFPVASACCCQSKWLIWNGNPYFIIDSAIFRHFILIQQIFSYLYGKYHPNKMSAHMNRIKKVLEEKGIKQTWLAEKLGKSFSIVNALSLIHI